MNTLMKTSSATLIVSLLSFCLATRAAAQSSNTAHPGGKLPGDVAVQLVQIAGGFVDPIDVTSPHDGTGRLFVCERPGTIRIIKDGKVLDEQFYSNRPNPMFQFLEEGLY